MPVQNERNKGPVVERQYRYAIPVANVLSKSSIKEANYKGLTIYPM